MADRRLLLATTNAGKVREFRGLLAGCGWQLVAPDELGLTLEVEETGTTYEENARLKAEAWAAHAGLPALADDSGLEVDALGGAPGLHSARYAGQGTSHADKIEVLLQAIETAPEQERGARFRAVLVVAFPGGRMLMAEGVCEGRLTRAPRGAAGFGYDPIFQVKGAERTMAELSTFEKNRLSHRALAAQQICAALKDLADDNTVATSS